MFLRKINPPLLISIASIILIGALVFKLNADVQISTTPSKQLDFDFSGQGLTDTDLPNLVFAEGLTAIDLSDNSFSNLSLLNLPPTIIDLSIDNCNLQSLSGLILPASMDLLTFDENQISNLNGFIFPTSLRVFSLSDNNLSDLSNVNFPDNLQILDLSLNKAIQLNTVTLSPSLKTLFLVDNDFEDSELAQLSLPEGLEKLSLIGNGIRNPGGLNLPSTLLELDLERNLINDLSTLQLPPNLKKLVLKDNLIQDSTLEGLVLPDSIRTLNLSDCLIRKFRLKLPKKIKRVNLKKNSISKAERARILRKYRNRNIKFLF